MPDNVIALDWLDHATYVAYLRGAAVCIVFGNYNPQQVPGKVYQTYRFAQRILYIASLPEGQDEARTILALKAEVCENSQDGICLGLRGALSKPPASAASVDYSWAAAVADMAKVISGLRPANPDG
jgi:hypothetical protein